MKILLTFAFATITITLFGQFRNTKWGDSMEDVKTSESEKFIGESMDLLEFQGSLDGVSVLIHYLFKDNKLISASYRNFENHFSEIYYLGEWNTWYKSIVNKHGQPTIANTYLHPEYENDPILGLKLGKANFADSWLINDTEILHVVLYDDSTIKHQLHYIYKPAKSFLDNLQRNVNIKSDEISTSVDEFTITFAGTEIIYNNHVGNEWVSFGKIGDKKLYVNEKLTVSLNKGGSLRLISYLQETEEKYNDHANKTVTLDYHQLSSFRGGGFSIIVELRESNGRYAGNTAQMKFYYSVE